MFDLTGHRALITGGGGALGSAVAEAYLSTGSDVVIADAIAPRDLVDRLRRDHPERSVNAVEFDVTDESAVIAGVEEARALLGGTPDIVVTAAGIGQACRVEDMSGAEWRRMIAVHLDGTFHVLRHTLSAMLEARWGRFVCFSSIAATEGVDAQAHYSAAKAGVEGLVRSLAAEVADRGVTVNAIAPGYFESTLNDLAPPERLERLRANVPSRRFGDPREIGALAVYLSSPEASYLTGEVVSPNGGFHYNALIARP